MRLIDERTILLQRWNPFPGEVRAVIRGCLPQGARKRAKDETPPAKVPRPWHEPLLRVKPKNRADPETLGNGLKHDRFAIDPEDLFERVHDLAP